MRGWVFEAWRCRDDETKFCPPEGCSRHYGCAREKGWVPGEPTPPGCDGRMRNGEESAMTTPTSEAIARLEREHLRQTEERADREAKAAAHATRCWEQAMAERNGLISRLRLHFPHIKTVVFGGEPRDPGPPTCMRCTMEDRVIGQPWHDGLGPSRAELKAAPATEKCPHGKVLCGACEEEIMTAPAAHAENKK